MLTHIRLFGRAMTVDGRLSIELGDHYRSASQKARVNTEAWVKDNLYSPGRRGELLPYG